MANDIVRIEDNEKLQTELSKLIDFYTQFFTGKQMECLILFWYGLSADEVSSRSGINSETLNIWLHDKAFSEAIQAGYGKKHEILSYGLQQNALKAIQVVEKVLDMDLNTDSKGFGEVVKTARWLLDKLNVNLSGIEKEEKQTSRIDPETARIVAEEIKKMDRNTLDNVKVESLFRDDVIEGELVDISKYYKIVQTRDVMVTSGLVNVFFDGEEEYKLQCHLCGKWFTSLAAHVRSAKVHSGLNLDTYRVHFSLPNHVPLSVDEDFVEMIEKKFEKERGIE